MSPWHLPAGNGCNEPVLVAPHCTTEGAGWRWRLLPATPPKVVGKEGHDNGLNSPEMCIWQWADPPRCWLGGEQLGMFFSQVPAVFQKENCVPAQLSFQMIAAWLHLPSSAGRKQVSFVMFSLPLGTLWNDITKLSYDTVGIEFCCIFLLNFWGSSLDFPCSSCTFFLSAMSSLDKGLERRHLIPSDGNSVDIYCDLNKSKHLWLNRH